MSEITEFGSTFRFTVNTKTLKKSKCVYTPEFEFSNSKWKVRFSRTTNDDGEKCLAIHLECVSLKKSSFFSKLTKAKEWSRDAQATFTLLQTDGHADKPIVKFLSMKTFEKKYLSHGIDDFIEWDTFLKDHAYATFEINISSSPLKAKRNIIQEIVPISAKMRVVIKDAKNLKTRLSSEFVIQGIRWRLCAQKKDEHLGVYLYFNQNDMNANWHYKVAAKFILLTSNHDSESWSKNYVHKFEKCYSNWGFPKFLKWSEFVDETKGYIYGKKAEFNVEIKVEDPEPAWKLQCPTPLETTSSFECIATPS